MGDLYRGRRRGEGWAHAGDSDILGLVVSGQTQPPRPRGPEGHGPAGLKVS